MGPVCVVAGALANKCGNGGAAWVRMTWAEGLRRLGADVWFVEEISPSAWGSVQPTYDRRVEWFDSVVRRFDLQGRSVLIDMDTGHFHGATREAIGEVADAADLVVNITGHLRSGGLLDRFHRRVYVDLDPGYTQIWHAQGADLGIAAHDLHLTVGTNIGRPGCPIPTGDIDWVPILPPVLLDEWPVVPLPVEERCTTVASWRGGYGPLHHDGVDYGAKAHEFRRIIDLPRRDPATFELALDIHPADDADRRALVDHGWRLVEPGAVAATPDAFGDYVRGSWAEFSPAQGVYAHGGTGWASDRTAHYLASGRPAIVQDTGTEQVTRAVQGLLTFHDVESAAAAVSTLRSDPSAHAEAARRLAEERFDADRVLGGVLERAGL